METRWFIREFALIPEVTEGFSDLPKDPYCPGRFRRFSQYRLANADIALLPRQPHFQEVENNAHVGGIERNFEPLLETPTELIDAIRSWLELADDEPWQVDIHQWRMSTPLGTSLDTVPEGPHRDGRRHVVILVASRSKIEGGVTQLFVDDVDEPVFESTLGAGSCLIVDDRAVLHYTTPIRAIAELGHRDVWVLTFSPWTGC